MRLYITVGPPGAGKSTYAKELVARQFALEKESIVVLNADELRGFYGKDEADQSVSYQAFQFIKFATEMLFRQGFSVLIDVTSKNKRSREEFLEIAKKYGAQTVALCFRVPLGVCQARNAARSRVVPPEVVEGIFNQIQWPEPGEFDSVRDISR